MAWLRRLTGLWKRDRRDLELDEELRYHFDRRITDSINAGMTPREAYEDAQRSFGNFTLQKERTRDMDILGWLESFAQDVRYGIRSLAKNPGFATVAILTLALGIGANTAIFSVVNGVLLKPLPFDHPEEIVWFQDVQLKLSTWPLSAPEFIAYRDQNHTLSQIAAFRALNFTLTGRGPAESVRVGIVTPQYLSLIRVAPALGRDFTEADGRPGAPRVAILTDGYWKSALGGDAGAIGQTLTLNGESVTIVGVLPKDYIIPGSVSFFMNPKFGVPEVFPGGPDPSATRTHFVQILGRLKPDTTLAQAQAEFSSIISNLNKANNVPADKAHAVRIIPWTQLWIGDSRSTLLTLLAVVGFVLLIACANVANLLLARSASRTREIAVRAAMGATSWRLARQLITEGALLGFLGGLVSLPLAYVGVKAFVASKPIGIPKLFAIQIDAHVLLFTFAIAVFAGIIFGLAPALRGVRVSAGESLKQAGRAGSGGVRQNWTRSILVISEVALSLVLLAAAGLLVRSFVHLLEVNPGFRPERIMTFALSFSGPKYKDLDHHPERMARYLETLKRIETLPGVEGVASSNDVPLTGQDTSNYLTILGESAVPSNEQVLVGMHGVSPGYFRAMGIALLRGREISGRDVPGAPAAAVISQNFAQRVWPGQDPIGKQFRLFTTEKEPPEVVVGVVANVKNDGLDQDDSTDAYESVAQQGWPYAEVAVRTAQGGESLLPSIRAIIAEYDPELAVASVRTMDEIAAASLGSRKLTLTLVGLFASLAMVLAMVGIYGVMSYVVAGRTQEIGIRIALGAQRADVFKLVVGQGMALAGAGLVLGLIAASGVTRYLGSQLFHVNAIDPLTYGGVTVLLGAVALLACYIPARRATRVDPLVALRYE
ncbi:MAG TPA: ABC transporter permease [Candidatus Acidoferrales bacterium]